MDDEKKRNVMIAVIVGCLIGAGGIFYFTNRDSSGPRGDDTMHLLCVKCKHTLDMSAKEYNEKIKGTGDPMAMPMMGPAPLTCPKCSQKSLFACMVCPKCQTYFMPSFAGVRGYPARCPSCKFSALEEKDRQNN